MHNIVFQEARVPGVEQRYIDAVGGKMLAISQQLYFTAPWRVEGHGVGCKQHFHIAAFICSNVEIFLRRRLGSTRLQYVAHPETDLPPSTLHMPYCTALRTLLSLPMGVGSLRKGYAAAGLGARCAPVVFVHVWCLAPVAS